MIKKYYRQIKTKKWALMIGLLIIPFSFIGILLLIGMIITIAKTSQFHFSIMQVWTNAMNTKYVVFLALIISIMLYLIYSYKISKVLKTEPSIKTTDKTDFGNAKWLTKKQLNHSYPLVKYQGQSINHGFVVNSQKKQQAINFNIRSNTHSLIIGGTGSGKTQGLVLPTIQVNSQAKLKPTMIITDPKGELLALQSHNLQQQGYDIKVINLRNLQNSMCWNPLQQIYQQHQTMLFTKDQQTKLLLQVQIQSDIQDLCKTLFPKAYHEKQPFWSDSGANITEAIILGMLEDLELALKEKPNVNDQQMEELINEILPANKFNLASVTIIATMKKELIQWLKKRDDTSIVKVTASNLIQGEVDTIGNIMMTISTQLSIFKNSYMQNITSKNDLNFQDLINKPTALFIIVPDENYNYHVIASLLISQIYKFLIAAATKVTHNKLARPVYFLCDEFGNIPIIPHMDNIISVARSRNIFFQLIIQDIQQIIVKYGKEIASIIFANCSLHIFLQTMDYETANRYAQMLGEQTVLQISTSGQGASKSQSTTLKGHQLISAADLMQLPIQQAIIFYSKENPAKTHLLPWWKISNSKSSQSANHKNLELINFKQDYYYDIKKSFVWQTPISNNFPKNIKNFLPIDQPMKQEQQWSKIEIMADITRLKAELANYNDDTLCNQEIKLAINKQIARLEKQLQNQK